eukprot:185330_1
MNFQNPDEPQGTKANKHWTGNEFGFNIDALWIIDHVLNIISFCNWSILDGLTVYVKTCFTRITRPSVCYNRVMKLAHSAIDAMCKSENKNKSDNLDIQMRRINETQLVLIYSRLSHTTALLTSLCVHAASMMLSSWIRLCRHR